MSTVPQKPFSIQYQCYGIGYLKYEKKESDPLFQCFGFKKIVKQDASHSNEISTGIKKETILDTFSHDAVPSFTKSPLFLQRRDICLGCLHFSSKTVDQPKCLGAHFILLQEKVQKCYLTNKNFHESPPMVLKKKKKDFFFFNKFYYRTGELLLRTKSLIKLHVLNNFQIFPNDFYQRVQFLPFRSFEILMKCMKSPPKN